MSSQRHRMPAGEPYAAPAADAPRPAATPGRPALSHKTPGRKPLGHTPLDGPAFHRKAPAPRGI
ncbi:hypothetical protein [Streptomyces sp. RTd22]|uniref:hypothetical protein n=1 Tax=Streptomyces sp. RTd22 TaxID=1841249 RepID=UPI00131AB206|nr:hypothetical protein [Streptomyces sp. RTd22]